MARFAKPNLTTVGGRIIAARLELGMKQEELAQLIHVAPRTMQSYESNDVVPYMKIPDLADVLNRSPAWLLHGEAAGQTPSENLRPVLEEIRDVLKQQLDLMK